MDSFANMRKKATESERHRARHRAGGKVHSDAAEDRALIDHEFKKLEAKEGDEKKAGGKVHGKSAPKRLDHGGKFAKGGRVKHGKGGKGKVTTNVIIAPQGGGAGGPPHPPMMLPPGMKPPMGAGPGGPPMPPPGAGGPPGMPPGAPPQVGPMKRGGRVKRASGGAVKPEAVSAKQKGGAGGARGRLDKAKAYGA